MPERTLLDRITVNPAIFGGKPIVRGRRLDRSGEFARGEYFADEWPWRL